jgi:hypothetical protein
MDKFGELSPKEFYNKFAGARQSYEDIAVRVSKMTLPYVMPEQGFSSSSKLSDEIAQSYCGRLVNTLKAKMGMSLLPPSTSSFRLSPDAEALEAITGGNPDMNAEVYAKISSVTARINNEIENQQIRDKMFDMLLQLIAVGSCIIEKIKDDGIMIHTLRNFAVDLDSRGEARGMCIVEEKKDLPEGITPKDEAELYNLYTLIEFNYDEDKWYVTQSIEDEIVGKEIKYKADKLPFEYVGWTFVTGDKYHRSYAEDYIDDMEQYNTLSNLLTKGSVIAAKSIIFVDQRGNRTKLRDVSGSANGDVINGRADDVTAFHLDKNFDFQVPMARLQDIAKNLASAFLMNESVTRDAERVTAQEIRFMAQELESSSLSGIYSKLSKKVSKRIVQWVMDELKIKFEGIGINIITGLDALGRSQEAQKLDSLVMRMANLGLNQWLNEAELISRYASFDGIDVTGLIKTPSQVQQERQAQAQAQQQQVGAEAMAQSAGQVAGEQMVSQ